LTLTQLQSTAKEDSKRIERSVL